MNLKSLFRRENALPLAGAAVLSILAFSFGEEMLVNVAGTVLLAIGILTFLSEERKLAKTEKLSLGLYAVPFLVFGLAASLGVYQLSIYQSAFSGIVTGLLSLLGMVGCLVFGYSTRNWTKLDPWVFIYFLLGGLATLVLVSWLSTMILYGPWHPLIHEGQQYYWHGVAYDIENEVVFLLSGGMTRVSKVYAGGYAVVLAASSLPLLFLDWKKERGRGIFLSITGGIGLIFLVSVPLIEGLIVYFVAFLLAIGLRFAPFKDEPPKWLKIVSIAIVAVFVAVVAFYLAVVLANEKDLFSEGFLRKIFNNGRWTGPINDIVSATYYNNDTPSFLSLLFGMDPYVETGNMLGYNFSRWSGTAWILVDLKTFEFNAFLEGGLVAFVALLFILFTSVLMLYHYVHDERRSPLSALVLPLALTYLIYFTFFSDMTPLVLKGEANTYVSPFNGNPLFFLILFLLGMSYRPVYYRKRLALEGISHE